MGSEHQTEERREAIRRRRLARRKIGFYWHQWSYISVNLALVLVNVLVSSPLWFQWSVLGWGIGLACHYKALYFTRGKKYENRVQLGHKRVGCLMSG
jgi:1,4-dihydroxy-2-naphthoate octaprenyltransferase